MEERNQGGRVDHEVLEPAVEAFPRRRPSLRSRLLEDRVRLRRREVAAQAAVPGVKEGEREVVRIVVVRDPAAEPEIKFLRVVPGLDELGHRLRGHLDLDAEFRPGLEERAGQAGVLVLQDRVHGRLELLRQREPG
ncbi:MAG TPA: hypothetical protein VIZ58_01720 [Thermoanaerobaculia bacterium]